MDSLQWFRDHIRELVTDEAGASAVEYALVMAVIVAACVLAYERLGQTAGDVASQGSNTLTGERMPPPLR
jgi:Flp pilus assembly pilin Flp